MIAIKETNGGVMFALRVHPKAKKNAITGVMGDALKLAVTAAPEGGRANEAVVGLLAKLLRLPRGSVTIAAGHSGRNKSIRVTGISAQVLHQTLQQLLEGSAT